MYRSGSPRTLRSAAISRSPTMRGLMFVLLLCVSFLGAFSESLCARPAPIAVVDVMILYTPQARDGAGGPIAIQNAIDLAMLEANQVFQNSQIHARLRLV